MGGLQSTERSLSATASKGLSALRAVTDLCCAVNQRLTSVVRETRTLRSVGAGGFGPRRPGGCGDGVTDPRLRHRQTKGTETVERLLSPPRHISTPPKRFEILKTKAPIVL